MRKFFGMLAVLLLCAMSSAEAACAEGLFGSESVTYAKAHLGAEDAGLRKAVLQEYFRSVNKSLSAKRTKNYSIYVEDAAAKFEMDPFLAAALMVAESKLEWKARDENHYGLMMIEWDANRQWIYRDYPQIKSLRILFKPVLNVRVGTQILRDNLNQNGGDYDATIERCYARGRVAFCEEVAHHYENLVTMYRDELQKPKEARMTPIPAGDTGSDED